MISNDRCHSHGATRTVSPTYSEWHVSFALSLLTNRVDVPAATVPCFEAASFHMLTYARSMNTRAIRCHREKR